MREINLLPWREGLRREAQRNFMILLVVAAVAAAGIVFALNQYFDAQISNQNQRNAYLSTEISKLDRQIARIDQLDETRSRLLERKRVIEELQANRTLMVRLFDQLVRTVPTGIRLLNARQVADQITINGTSQSSTRVSTYLRNLEAAGVLHDPELRIIEAETNQTDSQMPFLFTVSATVASPESDDDQSQTGTGAAE